MRFDLTAAQRMVYDAASDRVDSFLKAWREQIESDYQLILKAGEKLKEEDEAARRYLEQQAQQQAMDAALDSAVSDYLEGLLNKAQTVDVSALSIPGVHAVSGLSTGVLAEISALSNAVMTADITNTDHNPRLEQQDLALRALERGLVPHPMDLASVQQANKIDLAFAMQFQLMSQEIDRLDSTSFKHPRLKVQSGLQRLNLLRDYGDHLSAYGSDRLVTLVSSPQMLVGVPTPALPQRTMGGNRSGMPERDFNQMLSSLFAKPRS